MKQKLLVLIAVLYVTTAFSQSEIPVRKYKQKSNAYGKLYEKIAANGKLFGGVTMFNFQNKNYSLNQESGELSSSIGYVFGLEFTFKTFTITGQYVNNNFTIKDAEKQFPSLSGGDLSLAWNLPSGISWGNFFVGGGYSFYELDLYDNEERDSDPTEVMKLFTPSVKVGFYIHFSEFANLKLEYQQSLKMEDKFAHNRINLTLGFGTY